MIVMKRIKISSVLILLLVTTQFATGVETTGRDDDPIFRAMSDELNRSMGKLVIEEMQPPYFLSYLIRDDQTVVIEARFGSLLQSEQTTKRSLSIELRVGSPKLDNTNYLAKWQDLWNHRENLVEEDNYETLRHQIWYHTDLAYKRALENLAGKNAYLQANPPKKEIPDFSPVEPFTYFEERAESRVDQAAWEERIRIASGVFENYTKLQDWHVMLVVQTATRWYVNSEGSRNRRSDVYYILNISATTQAEDGERLTAFNEYLTPAGEKPPSSEELAEDIRELAAELEAMADASPLDEYVGPVMFTNQAAAQFISHLFVGQLTLTRKPLTQESWMTRYLPVGKLTGRIKRRVFPDFVSVTDEPRREKWNGTILAGHRLVDSEGVQSQDITLVEDGRLLTLPLGRQPTEKVTVSNGHARAMPIQRTVPGITNLIVTTSKPVKMKKMIGELRRLCRNYDTEYGLLIKQLEEEPYARRYRTIDKTEDTEDPLPRPTIVYKVYSDDGRMEPVRGLTFDEVTIRNLRDIVAMGRDSRAYNLAQSTVFSGFRYTASIITPSILVEEMELKAGSLQEPLPVAGNPMFTGN